MIPFRQSPKVVLIKKSWWSQNCRYCLWILGDGRALMNSDTVWSKVVLDAKDRGCYFNADEDKRLLKAIIDSLVERGQLYDLLNMNSLLFKDARWKVCD